MLILTEDAQQHLDDAFQWYQEQNHGLGQEFIAALAQNFQKSVVIPFITGLFVKTEFIAL